MHASAPVEPSGAELAGALAAWALATRTPGSTLLHSPPIPAGDAPEIVGTAVAFHYVNRMVNVFLDELPISRLGRFRDVSRRLLALAMQGFRRSPRPGDSLSLLPAAELPEDLAWTRSNPAIAGAYARFATAAEEYGRQTLPGGVRRLRHWVIPSPMHSFRRKRSAASAARRGVQAAASRSSISLIHWLARGRPCQFRAGRWRAVRSSGLSCSSTRKASRLRA